MRSSMAQPAAGAAVFGLHEFTYSDVALFASYLCRACAVLSRSCWVRLV